MLASGLLSSTATNVGEHAVGKLTTWTRHMAEKCCASHRSFLSCYRKRQQVTQSLILCLSEAKKKEHLSLRCLYALPLGKHQCYTTAVYPWCRAKLPKSISQMSNLDASAMMALPHRSPRTHPTFSHKAVAEVSKTGNYRNLSIDSYLSI